MKVSWPIHDRRICVCRAVCCLLLIACQCPAAILCPPKVIRQHSFGGSNFDDVVSILPASDNGFILAGSTQSPPGGNKTSTNFGSYDVWVVKTSSTGTVLWDRTFGGLASDYLEKAMLLPNGEILLGASSASGAEGNKDDPGRGLSDFWMLRLDSNGNKLSEWSYGTVAIDRLLSFDVLPDGGMILAGSLAGLPSLVRVGPDGELIWERNIGEVGHAVISVQTLRDGGFVCGGHFVNPVEERDYWIIRLDSSGTVLWDRKYGGNSYDILSSIAPARGGGFWMIGSSIAGVTASGVSGNKTSPSLGLWDCWLVRLDEQGSKVWEQAYGGAGSDLAFGLQPLDDGGLLIAGARTALNAEYPNGWLLRIDRKGRKFWQLSLGGSAIDYTTRLLRLPAGGFIVGGISSSPSDGTKTSPSFGNYDSWVIRLGKERICDSDGDGVPDAEDRCPGTLRGAKIDASGCSLDQVLSRAGYRQSPLPLRR